MKGTLVGIAFCFLCISFGKLSAQDQEHHSTPTAEHKKDPGLETVLSGLFIYNPQEERLDLATELHITYWNTHKWAFGIGYFIAFEEEGRVGHELAALVSHKPWSYLTINVGPSFSLPNSHKNTQVSAYIEGEFNFKLGILHVGPLAGTLLGESVRPFAGIHLGYEF